MFMCGAMRWIGIRIKGASNMTLMRIKQLLKINK